MQFGDCVELFIVDPTRSATQRIHRRRVCLVWL